MLGSAFDIAEDALAAVYAHALEGHPEEVCGLLIGPADAPAKIDESRRCENLANAMHARDPVSFPRTAAMAYVLGPADLMRVDRSQSSPRPVRAIYHSHVEVGAYFSDEDKRIAAPPEWGMPLYPGVDYLVVDVRSDGARGARLYRWNDDTSDFDEVSVYGEPEGRRASR